MSAGKKIIEEKQTYLKVLNLLSKILYCIGTYFTMWAVQSQEKKWSGKWVFVTGRTNKKKKLAPIIVVK